MVEENVSQEFRLKNIAETTICFIKETERNELMSKKHKQFFTILNYIQLLLILVSAVTGCISVSAFGITSSPTGSKDCTVTSGISKYKSIIKKKKKNHDKIVLLAKTKLN